MRSRVLSSDGACDRRWPRLPRKKPAGWSPWRSHRTLLCSPAGGRPAAHALQEHRASVSIVFVFTRVFLLLVLGLFCLEHTLFFFEYYWSFNNIFIWRKNIEDDFFFLNICVKNNWNCIDLFIIIDNFICDMEIYIIKYISIASPQRIIISYH